MAPDEGVLRRSLTRAQRALAWTPPTTTEVVVVFKAGLAAGISYSVAKLVTGVPNPILAPATTIVVVHATVWSSVRSATQRSIAVAAGVIVALAIGDAIVLNGLTVAILVTISLGISVLLLRFTGGSANQLPITVLLVLAVVSNGKTSYGLGRAVDTLIGAAIGGFVSLVLPASRLQDARETLGRLASATAVSLQMMSDGVRRTWSQKDASEWNERAQRTRYRLARQAVDAVGAGERAAKWNHRDRRHLGQLAQYQEMASRLERVSISVSEIARGLDQTACRRTDAHPSMARLSALLDALADAVRTFGRELDDPTDRGPLLAALGEVRERRENCEVGATRRARLAVDAGNQNVDDPAAEEWLDYGNVLLQADWIVADLTS
jgi:uncharacterized membrane protein YgaE (UPF0421/DUF939 family)